MSVPELANLRLVGGTSMALQVGHRKSVDLDLFGSIDLEPEEVVELISTCGSCSVLKRSRNIHVFIVDGIKVDIVNYKYPWLSPVKEMDGLRLASLDDIAAMKLSAVTGRGTRKDFIDIYFLLEQFGMQEMMDYYMLKYADGSLFMVLKSLTYFEDAELDPEPHMLKSVDWNALKSFITKEVACLI